MPALLCVCVCVCFQHNRYYALKGLETGCGQCIKLFEGINAEESVSKSKGQIQKELSEFLIACPKGIVVI